MQSGGRCYLVYALAPEGTSPREANDLLNAYVADDSRGLAVWHDHFIGAHGGAVVLHVRSDAERALLEDPGPLAGWRLAVHPLMYSLTAPTALPNTNTWQFISSMPEDAPPRVV